MPMRLPFVRGAVILLPLLALCSAARAEAGHMVRVTYQVADLVVPVPDVVQVNSAPAPKAAPPATQEDNLMKLITSTIEPTSWSEKGGKGTIDYHPLTMGLVVCQTPDVQEQIADLLNSLRRLQDIQVSLEVRLITVDEAYMDRLQHPEPPKATDDMKVITGIKMSTEPLGDPIDGGLRALFLNDAQAWLFMEALQDDRRANVMQLPKVTLFNGQTAVMDITDPQDAGRPKRYLNDFNPAPGPETATGQVEKTPTGLRLTAKPVVSADRRFVSLNLNSVLASVNEHEPQKVVAGQSGDAGPTPPVSRLALDCKLRIVDGGTVLITGWKRERWGRTEYASQPLSSIPYLGRLFRNVGYCHETECVLMMVTPRIMVTPEAEERQTGSHPEQPATPCPDVVQTGVAPPCHRNAEADALVQKYHQACADGRMAEATQFAVKALAIDPTCFHNDGVPSLVPCTTAAPTGH
jgi:type II secretory pathway component GspD/PulD (secretin)